MCGLGIPEWPPVSGMLTCCVLDYVDASDGRVERDKTGKIGWDPRPQGPCFLSSALRGTVGIKV